MIALPGGAFWMGSDDHYAEEAPRHRVEIDGFQIDRYPVTNSRFAAFVDATGHVTDAEREGISLVFSPDPDAFVPHDVSTWWQLRPLACWHRPGGAGTSWDAIRDHPVVHVSLRDAQAFAAWDGSRLPTEAQWEYAARGGIDGAAYCWGDAPRPSGHTMARIFEGSFPLGDPAAGTVPVGSYPPNGHGLFDMAGNVWEWTTGFFNWSHDLDIGGCCAVRRNPGGPRTPIVDHGDGGAPLMVLKGGSFLCADDYCARYRPAARIPQAAGVSTCHVGFRCVRPLAA